MVGRTLVETSRGEEPVVVANFSREPQKIKEGELVELCQEVDHEWHHWKVYKVEHSIDTGDHRPIKQPARRMAPAQRQEMEKVKENIRSQGVIEKSSSPWTSAVVLVRKKDGSTFDQELERMSEVFNRIRAAHLKLNPKKCHLFQKEVKYLGHIVGKSGVHTDPEKVSAVKDWLAPTCVKDLRSFLGLCTYYRRFVKDFASITAPLHKLLGKRQKFEWNAMTQKAFDELKQALVSSPVLPYPDQSQPFILDCDASNHGIGGVLSQKKGDQEYEVAYYTKKLSPPERNYCVTRKELLAVVKSRSGGDCTTNYWGY
ncbi:hypothetical protein Pcinc_006866 [Petrolisthes cinctipes]|uniref:Reverse transcriptase/retrotransposon-derived protein RNase H-like domain-containing protein n=1 Tax=Petrolisthes cinctipes TaxID=88211 RepID=A0AAE1G9Q8_PETCI|nr:hypothetical protein Pcinc_006866 [Petrolisthes cinctipes]